MPWETLPKIVWSANTLTFRYPLDGAVAWREARAGSDEAESDTGDSEDAWIEGWDYFLAGQVDGIPTTDAAGATGWDGATGWEAFLAWAWQRNTFLWYPNKDAGTNFSARIVLPKMKAGRPALSTGSFREFDFQIKSWATPKVPFTGY